MALPELVEKLGYGEAARRLYLSPVYVLQRAALRLQPLLKLEIVKTFAQDRTRERMVKAGLHLGQYGYVLLATLLTVLVVSAGPVTFVLCRCDTGETLLGGSLSAIFGYPALMILAALGDFLWWALINGLYYLVVRFDRKTNVEPPPEPWNSFSSLSRGISGHLWYSVRWAASLAAAPPLFPFLLMASLSDTLTGRFRSDQAGRNFFVAGGVLLVVLGLGLQLYSNLF